jgi:hypothetical protein
MADAKNNEVAASGVKAVQGAKRVVLVSSYISWEPVDLKLQKDGIYAVWSRLRRQTGSMHRN